ncbi:MAG: DUF885 domain-containing protein [Chitinophagaceae bacterium]
MRIFVLTAFACLLLAACDTNRVKGTSNNIDQRFDNYKEGMVQALWKLYPEWASSIGYHVYDSILNVPDAADRDKKLAFWKAQQDSLQQFNPELLTANNRTDFLILKSRAESSIWYLTELKSYTWDPSEYNVSSTFAKMLSENYDSLDTRLRHFYQRMAGIPAYYAAAQQNLQHPTAEHTELSIGQNLGGLSVFTTDLPDSLAKSKLSAGEKTACIQRAGEAIKAMNSYVAWLKQLKPDSARSFRLGRELYAKKFGFDIESGYTAEQVYQKALDHKKELHAQMARLADQLWPKYMGAAIKPSDPLRLIRQVIDKISLNHVQPDSFQSAIEKQIPVLTAFVKEKNLLYLDPSKPLVVRKEPAYMAGIAGASISSPGPYDKGGNTYYNVGSLAGWDAAQAESYLREYNDYILQILNIHEAIPGHYAQLVYSSQSPSIIKSVFENGAMIEGWAVYAERMMLERGYGHNEPEMWLLYYKWNLRSTCNMILDYSVHVNNMSKEEAMHLLVNEAFQQQAEAEGKWRRVSLTQVQLCSYFAGYSEIYDLREELRKKRGDAFDLKAFHEEFLSYGSAPVKYIAELMRKEQR